MCYIILLCVIYIVMCDIYILSCVIYIVMCDIILLCVIQYWYVLNVLLCVIYIVMCDIILLCVILYCYDEVTLKQTLLNFNFFYCNPVYQFSSKFQYLSQTRIAA